MSAGSGASNLGYGNIAPLSNINGRYVNVDSSNSPATFSSNQIPGMNGLPGLSGAKNNVDAAAGYVPNICLFKGGSKVFKNKIKKISRQYKMNGRKNTKSIKRRIRSRFIRKTNTKSRRRRITRRRGLKGGYSQYQNNLPMTPSYSVGGILKPNDLALANPPPFKVLPNCTNCVDNYNHYTGQGFPSRGH